MKGRYRMICTDSCNNMYYQYSDNDSNIKEIENVYICIIDLVNQKFMESERHIN